MLHTFRPNKSYAYSPSNLVVIIDFNNPEINKIIITFIGQNCRPLEIEDTVNLTLVINK